MSTRLSPEAYLEHLQADAARLSELARTTDPDAPVPTCPGWTLRDLVVHCGEVYAHKSAALRLGHAPSVEDWPRAPEGPMPVAYHDEQLALLVGELSDRGPDAPTWTWFPGEKRTGFWFRRMAQEALVHRVDGELTAGLGIAEVGLVDPVLATDGVDEVLAWFAGHPGVLAHSQSRAGRAGEVYVEAGDHAFVVELPDDGHVVREVDVREGVEGGASGPAEVAVLRGAPADLDLMLWGRPTTGEVTEQGDRDVLARLYSRLNLAVSD